ncbi:MULTISPECIES: hypothetical protein [Chryseobacterium]|uniref:Uncharacterized protein n=1 Tax=Chryseobacterium geocarposphaerae TaxID=1416776 RepID=A0ABU1LEB0_9FLAO|nr:MULTISPECIES: hypothetical protein [Chryseobacterium]MDR6405049.1 hypothetical protein [Chryseobacterium geocarposphaerae]MDR6697832.1 hypothetical protein [Chryseobacterium ginsenosidimutans]
MKALLRIFIVVIIIIGGVLIIVVGKKPFPEPECIVCGPNLVRILGIAEIILGLGALVIQGNLMEKQRNI